MLIAFLAAAALPLPAQETSEVTLDSSPQVFTVLYALRAAGVPPTTRLDRGPAAQRIEASLRQLPPEVVAPLQEYFTAHPQADPNDFSPYISLALVLGPPPKFTIGVPEDHIPPDAYPLRELAPLLADFYQQAALADLWRQLRPFYDQQIAEKQSEVAQRLLGTRGYLRLIEAGYPSRNYVVYLDWLLPPTLTNARNYGESYYLILHPSHSDFLGAVRHQYLHFLLDPVAVKYASDIEPWARLQSIAERAPRLAKPFQQDTTLLVTECLIRAIELRLQKLDPAAATLRVTEDERAGYLFVRHFYTALDAFEQSEPSIRYYFPELLKGFNVDAERLRLASVQFLPLAPPPEEPPPTNAQQAAELLSEAESLMQQGDYTASRARLERVLNEFDATNPRALYGMALLASFEQDSERAKQFFLRTLEVASEPRILGWAHIYLARIYDLEGDREQALTHYHAALDLNTRLARVEEAARSGLARPFGEN